MSLHLGSAAAAVLPIVAYATPLSTPSKFRNYLKRLLIAPLNWGLGHATRCMPIIQALLDRGHEVIIASDGQALHLLAREYPQLTHLTLPSYGITYRTRNMVYNLGTQLPRILRTIRAERRAVQRIIQEHHIDGILSDNRYGCYSPQAHSLFMTHQVRLRMPYPGLATPVNALNRALIRRFDGCWIPDFPATTDRLSGTLADATGLPATTYIGPLSRLKAAAMQPVMYDLIIVLSGPEPQRTALEKHLLAQVTRLNARTLLVRGRTDLPPLQEQHGKLTTVQFMTADALAQALAQSRVIVTRSGYSTLMDLAALGRKAILIPTPGQTEQEYLATYFAERHGSLTMEQGRIDLAAAYAVAQHWKPSTPQHSALLATALDEWLAQV